MSTKLEECFTEYVCFKCQATHIKRPENFMTDRTEQAEKCPFCGKLPIVYKHANSIYATCENPDCCLDGWSVELKRWNTRSNSPDTVKLERLNEYQLMETMLWTNGAYKPEHIEEYRTIAKAICKRFGTVKESNTDHTNYACICKECGGQVKVPTVEELGDFIYQTLHTTGGEPTNTLSKPVCYELGRLIHQLLTGGGGNEI